MNSQLNNTPLNREDKRKANCLEDIRKILIATHKPEGGWNCFFYNTTKDLLNAQLLLIELGEHCVSIVDKIDYGLRGYIYNILTLLFLRGEFCIENLRFKKSSKDNVNAQSSLDCKQKIGLKYQMVLYEGLKICLEKVNKPGLSDYEKEFMGTFLAIVFFRIPEFRSKFLTSLQNPNDKEFLDQMNANFSLNDTDEKGGMTCYNLFNWDKEFYAGLPEVINWTLYKNINREKKRQNLKRF